MPMLFKGYRRGLGRITVKKKKGLSKSKQAFYRTKLASKGIQFY